VWGDAAIFVDPEDSNALAEGIGELIGDADRRAVLASRSRDRAREYTAERMAAGYLDAYRAAGARVRPACGS
jgi:glycosyltransferase involved in cell wall biosynthesis